MQNDLGNRTIDLKKIIKMAKAKETTIELVVDALALVRFGFACCCVTQNP